MQSKSLWMGLELDLRGRSGASPEGHRGMRASPSRVGIGGPQGQAGARLSSGAGWYPNVMALGGKCLPPATLAL